MTSQSQAEFTHVFAVGNFQHSWHNGVGIQAVMLTTEAPGYFSILVASVGWYF